MRKRKIVLLIIGIFLIIISVIFTSQISTKNEKKVEKNYTSKFKDLGYLGKNIKKTDIICDELKNIVDIATNNYTDRLFITSDGSLYQLSIYKLYSNDTNCKRIETNTKFKRFLSGEILLDIENNISQYRNKEFISGNEFFSEIDKSIYDNILEGSNTYYYLKDNELYPYVTSDGKLYEQKGEGSRLKDAILSEKSVLSLLDEKIVYSIGGVIKTDKKFYIYKKEKLNKEECEKYADVKCNYKKGFMTINNKNISSQFKNITFLKDNIIIDKNNNVYIGKIN